ncbi:probable G-protein coupled receptor 148 [Pelobates fuscus]|uniref:probable G-protein coupled receptor 148 n=1 Tax=Pelobates fuscus TaxID=191477 RepID=UPI002FE45C48
MDIDYINWTSSLPDLLSNSTFPISSCNDTLDESIDCTPRPNLELWIFLIPSAFCSIVTLLMNPLILFIILMNSKLRKETRYQLLANVMISDLIFLLFNTIISTCNTIGWYMHRIICFTLIVFTFAAYTSCVLTVTMMVIDTYIAICFPLHYHALLSLSRIKKVLLGIWIFSSVFPLAIFLLSQTFDGNPLERQDMCLMLYYGNDEKKNYLVTVVCALSLFFLFLCSIMIIYFYIKLYNITKQSGIWVNRFSRAKLTLMMHSVLLCLYIIPACVLSAEIMMFKNNMIGIDARMWMSAFNNSMVMMMPRALTPLVYGLRYRELACTIKNLFSCNKVSHIGTDC